MKKENNTQSVSEELKKKWQEEWTKIVHEGVACAGNDPFKKEKAALLEDIKRQNQKNG